MFHLIVFLYKINTFKPKKITKRFLYSNIMSSSKLIYACNRKTNLFFLFSHLIPPHSSGISFLHSLLKVYHNLLYRTTSLLFSFMLFLAPLLFTATIVICADRHKNVYFLEILKKCHHFLCCFCNNIFEK